MRTPVLLATALAAVSAVPAQGTMIPLPPYVSTFSSTGLSRGMFFQAPIAFNIVGVQVPDEAGEGVQNVQIYIIDNAPPTLSATYTPTANELVFAANGVPVTGTPIATGSISVPPGKFVVALGTAGTTTMRNSYAASGPLPSDVLGVPISLGRAGTQVNIASSTGPNPLFTGGGAVSRVELYVTPDPSFQFPPELVATAEPVPGVNPLTGDDGFFRAGEVIRWNFTDPQSNNAGLFLYNSFDLEAGGPPPAGVTAAIPGLVQRWMGSTPMGAADVVGPTLIGFLDSAVTIPPGLFVDGDHLRMQGFALDPRVAGPGRLPVNPTLNSIQYVFTSCKALEGFEGLSGVGNYPAGWSNGTGNREWRGDANGTPSSSTGPTSAIEGSTYFYCETSSPVTVGDVFSVHTETYTDASASSLEFQLSRIGSDIGQLDVILHDGVNPGVVLATYSGPDGSQTQGGTEWSPESLALSSLPASYYFEFRYTTLAVVSATFFGDIAIDDICIR